MSQPCDTCALRNGSVTWNEPYNHLRALICALAGIPFMCHHGFDWQTGHIFVWRRRFVTINVPDVRKLHTCAGWKREVAKLKEEHQFDVSDGARRLQIQLGRYALELIEQLIAEKDDARKEQHSIALGEVIKVLAQRTESEAA